tara:strand:- start:966 stop:1973 length:1008 start_codon:yes stop_codon:yes gene_type:complete
MNKKNKILVIRFSSIGDIVLTTSFLETIKSKFINSEIHFLTLDKFAPILDMQPNINRVISLSNSTDLIGLLRFKKYISLARYNYVYDLHSSLRSKFLTFGLDVDIKTINKPRLLRFILFQFHKNKFPKNFSTIMMYHQCINFDSSIKFPDTKLVVSKAEQVCARNFLNENKVRDSFVVLIPGAAWPQKQWYSSRYGKVINKIVKKTGKDIIMLGGKNDKICEEISLINNHVINFAGDTDLREAMAIISLSDIVFGSDTGLMHIAESLGKPVSMILGPTSVETGGGTYLKDSANIESDVWCRPCSQNGSLKCFRSSQYCMDYISTEIVTDSVLKRV